MINRANGQGARALMRLLSVPSAGPAPSRARAVGAFPAAASSSRAFNASARRIAPRAAFSSAGSIHMCAPATMHAHMASLNACAVATRAASTFLAEYRDHCAVREKEYGIAPKPLDAKQVSALVLQLENPPSEDAKELVDLFVNRVPPGVDEAAYVKASWLASVVAGDTRSPVINRFRAIEILGTMQGGYNIEPMIRALDDEDLADTAVKTLSRTLLMFDAFHDVEAKAKAGSAPAQKVRACHVFSLRSLTPPRDPPRQRDPPLARTVQTARPYMK